MKKSEEIISTPPKPMVITYPPDKLMQALFWIWDAFERTNMGMFLVYKTAEDVLKNKDLEGDRVTIGVRDLEWISGSTPILKAFTGNPIGGKLFENGQYVEFVVFHNPFNDVPVYVYIFKSAPCIQNTNQIFYRNEYFMLPNSYNEFIKTFGDKP